MKKTYRKLIENILDKKFNDANDIFNSLVKEKSLSLIEDRKVEVASCLLSEEEDLDEDVEDLEEEDDEDEDLDEAELKTRAASGKSKAQRKKEALRRQKGLSPTTGKRVDPKKSRKAKLIAKQSKSARKRGRVKAKRTSRRFK